MKHLTPLAVGAATLLLAPLLAAHAAWQVPPPDVTSAPAQASEVDLAGEVEDIIDEYDDAMAAFWEAYQATEDEDERNEIYQTIYPNPDDYVERLKAIVDQAPADGAALTAIAWMMENAEVAEHRAAFLSVLLEHHSKSSELAGICSTLANDSSRSSESFLRKLIEGAPSKEVSGNALYALAGILSNRLDLHESLVDLSEEQLTIYAEYYGEEVMKLCKDLDAEAVRKERKQLLVSVRDEYADVAHWEGTLGQAASGQLFELDHLQVGMLAPDISGPDLDGVDFKLSDYRGKVIFLDFWGDW